MDAKSLRTASRSMLSKIIFLMPHIAKPFNLWCNIVVLKYFLNSLILRNFFRLRLQVTSTIKRIRYATEVFEYQSIVVTNSIIYETGTKQSGRVYLQYFYFREKNI